MKKDVPESQATGLKEAEASEVPACRRRLSNS